MRWNLTRQTIGLLAGLALWAMPTSARAHAGNNDPNVVHVCIGNVTKVVRSVGVAGSCIAGPPPLAETPDHWPKSAIQGHQGEKGAKGDKGDKGDTGDPGLPGADGTGSTRADGPCFDDVNRYVDCGNGTVTDTSTGLIWLKQADCLPTNTWAAGNQAAAGLKDGDCGLTDKSSPGDWRLPTKAEWEAVITQRFSGAGICVPALANDAWTGCWSDDSSSLEGATADIYWSAITRPPVPTSTSSFPAAEAANLATAATVIAPRTATHLVWPVRSG